MVAKEELKVEPLLILWALFEFSKKLEVARPYSSVQAGIGRTLTPPPPSPKDKTHQCSLPFLLMQEGT